MGQPLTWGKSPRKPGFFGNFRLTELSLPPRTRVVRFLGQDLKGAEKPMHVNIIMIQPLIALLFGILILILPRLLNYLIAIYLIFIGLVGLFPHMFNTVT
jgi:hypothetical protein